MRVLINDKSNHHAVDRTDFSHLLGKYERDRKRKRKTVICVTSNKMRDRNYDVISNPIAKKMWF